MQASTVVTPTAGHCGTIFVAIELSQEDLAGDAAQPGPGPDFTS